jgi:hypothetical protein
LAQECLSYEVIANIVRNLRVWSMNKTPRNCTSVYLHLTHQHVSILSDHLQGAKVPVHTAHKQTVDKHMLMSRYSGTVAPWRWSDRIETCWCVRCK